QHHGAQNSHRFDPRLVACMLTSAHQQSSPLPETEWPKPERRDIMLTRRTALLSAGASLAIGCANAQPTPANPRYVTTHKPLPFRVQEIYPAAHKGRIDIAGGLLSNGATVTGVSDQHIA